MSARLVSWICSTICQCKSVIRFWQPTMIGVKLVCRNPNANREWFAQQHHRMLEREGAVSAYGKIQGNPSALLQLARSEPYYDRNRPHLCSFYAHGECNRGEACPYLHELPRNSKDPLAKQNIKDGYYGKNDPVAEKMLKNNKTKDDQQDDTTTTNGNSKCQPPPPSSKPKPPPLPPGTKPPLPLGPPPAKKRHIEATKDNDDVEETKE